MYEVISIMRTVISLSRSVLHILEFLMRTLFSTLALIFGLVFGPATASTFNAGAAYVVDGDTLHFGDLRVRLHGIDAPETRQAQGPIATQAMRQIVARQELTVHVVDRDRFGRLVAKVFLPDGRDVGAMLVRGGFALANPRFSTDYVADQRAAQAAGAGFWAYGGIENPAEFRARSR